MKIVCISDTHGLHQDIDVPDGDMLIHAGDLTVRGTSEQINDMLEWFGSLPHKYKILIAGNHDFGFEQKLSDIIVPDSVIYLENTFVEIEGLKIWGSPVSTPYYDWAFMWDISERTELYQKIPDNTDIVISHGPPYGVFDHTKTGVHAGCTALRDRLKQIKPKLCVFGHIHEDNGIKELEGTVYVNAAILDRQYKITNQAIVLEILTQ